MKKYISASNNMSFDEYLEALKQKLPKTYNWDYDVNVGPDGFRYADFFADDRVVGEIDDDPNIKLNKAQLKRDVAYLMEELG